MPAVLRGGVKNDEVGGIFAEKHWPLQPAVGFGGVGPQVRANETDAWWLRIVRNLEEQNESKLLLEPGRATDNR